MAKYKRNLEAVGIITNKAKEIEQAQYELMTIAGSHGPFERFTTIIEQYPEIDLNFKNHYGNTLLIVASKTNKFPIVKYLISQGADLNIQDKDGNTFLHHALKKIHPTHFLEIVAKSKEHGYDFNVKNSNGQSPLDIAKEKNADEQTLEILQTGESQYPVNIVSQEIEQAQYELMTIAGSHGPFERFTTIIELYPEIDLNFKNHYGNTLLIVASKTNKFPIVKYLISQGADLNIQDKDGNTFLHHALKKIHPTHFLEIVAKSKEHGYDFNVKNSNGQSPLDIAKEKNADEQTLEILQQYIDVDNQVSELTTIPNTIIINATTNFVENEEDEIIEVGKVVFKEEPNDDEAVRAFISLPRINDNSEIDQSNNILPNMSAFLYGVSKIEPDIEVETTGEHQDF